MGAAAGLGMQSSTGGLGLGMQVASGLGMPTAFVGSSNRQQRESSKPPQPTFVKDPNLGSWEKHTKGIGMKLLAKMGYKGSGGLGSKRLKKKEIVDEKSGEKIEVEAPAKTGISKPVEVVVRPNNLGLGFGNFKEASKLKTNQQIEAEVRGLDPQKIQKEKEEKQQKEKAAMMMSTQQKGQSSALPSVQDLMQQQSWKRGAKQSQQKSRKRPRRTVIPYQELLAKQSSQPSVFIDMRGPPTTAPEDGKEQEVPLAEELLHNLSLLLNTYENKIHSGSHFVRSTKQKVESLQSDIANMEAQQKENRDRVAKLNKVLHTIDQIEVVVNSKDPGDISTVQSLVHQLESNFTEEEKVKLRFFDVLAPSLLEPVLQARLEQWDPLTSDVNTTREIMDAVIDLCKQYPSSSDSHDEAGLAMMRAMFNKLLLPCVKHALDSQRWNPIYDLEVGLQLYEDLCRVVSHASSPKKSRQAEEDDLDHGDGNILPRGPEDGDDDEAQLQHFVQEDIINKTVYFKLMRALSQWKPALNDAGTGLQDRPDLWILPWMPHLDHRSILPTLLADCKRKLRASMSFLQKNIVDDDTFCQAALQTIRPWRNIYSKSVLPTLASTAVVTRAAKSVATAVLSSSGKNKDAIGCPAMEWKVVDTIFELHTSGLIADKEFLSIIEGELLSRWVARMQAWLIKSPSGWKEAVEVYIDWRGRLFSSAQALSRHCLTQDSTICALFYAVLLMIQAAHQGNVDLLDDLRPSATNVRAVLARRTREEREQAQEEMLRMEATGVAQGATSGGAALHDPAIDARVRAAQRHHGRTPTFREVVEEFAAEKEILFQPRMGSNATKDGKQIFLFGSIPVYLESDVVFVYQNSDWRPTSLTQLAMMAQQS